MKVFILKPWNEVSYQDALKKQQELTAQGHSGWLLFCCPPTITLGKQAHFSDVLMPIEELKRRGICLLPVDRGGLVTYHGPGQILGFPVGTLKAHTGDPRGVKIFIQKTQRILSRFTEVTLDKFVYPTKQLRTEITTEKPGAGVWIRYNPTEPFQKIVFMGMRFSKQGIVHGFALNVFPLKEMFELIVPCGEIGAKPGSLFCASQSTMDVYKTALNLRKFLNADPMEELPADPCNES